MTYTDGHSYCFGCGLTLNPTTSGSESIQFNTVQVNIPQGYISLTEYPGKSYIDPDILKIYGMGQLARVVNNRLLPYEGAPIVYLYYGWEHTLIGVKYRDLTRETQDKYVWWESGSQNLFFGLHLTSPNPSKVLVICEGESDTLAFATVYKEYLGNTLDIIGVSGASALHTKIQQSAGFIRQYGMVIIVTDSDSAGKDAREKAAELLPIQTTRYVSLPEKDVCECIEKGIDIKQYVEQAETWKDPDLITGQELTRRFTNYMNPTDFVGFNVGYPRINRMLGGGLQRGDILTVTGHTGSGKSTLVTNMVYSILYHHPEVNALWIGTEMQAEQSYRALIERQIQQRIRFNPETNQWSPDRGLILAEAERLAKRVAYKADIVGVFEETERVIKNAIISENVGVIVLDVINDIDPRMNKWEECRMLMQRLNLIARGNRDERIPAVAMILVGHTVKDGSGNYAKRIGRDDVRNPAILQLSTASIAVNGEVTQPKRFIELIKKPRMSMALETECWLEYIEQSAYYVELQTV